MDYKVPYHKSVEIWGDLTITVCDFEMKSGEPVCGVLLTSHDPSDKTAVGGSFDSPSCLFLTEEEIPQLIKALQEFTS